MKHNKIEQRIYFNYLRLTIASKISKLKLKHSKTGSVFNHSETENGKPSRMGPKVIEYLDFFENRS